MSLNNNKFDALVFSHVPSNIYLLTWLTCAYYYMFPNSLNNSENSDDDENSVTEEKKKKESNVSAILFSDSLS